ncbi:hypothetical protein [Dictyobacter kobayashii]|uniref:Uncharacterized protein n=1 Tax=Dictyobacter kobayashii TaxID=2014872 RepID=A0A402APR0_9CHLR|nr:hypothetical protein [Dictyobacter kobayashii]GCE21153.1 hypothetical protein KDK_49530 [Dictyobacter kobayashii]
MIWDGGGGDGGGDGGGGGGGCGNQYSCVGCTNTCDAGCSRVQCSNYPTNNFAEQQADIQAAQLLLLRAELRLALQGRPRQPIASIPEPQRSAQELDLLEKHLQGALEEVRGEREQLKKSSGE